MTRFWCAGVSRGHPFKTVYLPLSHRGNPGVNGVSDRGGCKLETPGGRVYSTGVLSADGATLYIGSEDNSVYLPAPPNLFSCRDSAIF